MGLFNRKEKKGAENSVGADLAAVRQHYPHPIAGKLD
jgi:hypothetical protein